MPDPSSPSSPSCPDALIFDAIRTPRGRARAEGSLHEVKPVALVAGLLAALAERNRFDSAQIEDVLIGCATPVAEQGGGLARAAVLAAGWDWMTTGLQIGRMSASGLDAVNLAAQKVRSGWEDLVVAGGVESASRVPPGSDGGAWTIDPETSLNSNFLPAGIAADLLATLDGMSREELDACALASQQRAAAAEAAGRLARSRVPVVDGVGMTVLTSDEMRRPGTTAESLAALKTAYQYVGELGFDAVVLRRMPQIGAVRHVHTAGNCAGLADGAALVLIGSAAKGAALGLVPRARVVATAQGGSDPVLMLAGAPVAARKALLKAGMQPGQIDLYEVEETHAAVVLRFLRKLEVPHERVNVNGGAIAMGHAPGASGAMLLTMLLDELEARGLRYGMAAEWAAAGMGCATIIERL